MASAILMVIAISCSFEFLKWIQKIPYCQIYQNISDQLKTKRTNERTDGGTYVRKSEGRNDCWKEGTNVGMNVRTNERTLERTYERTLERTYESTNERWNEQTNERTNETNNQPTNKQSKSIIHQLTPGDSV